MHKPTPCTAVVLILLLTVHPRVSGTEPAPVNQEVEHSRAKDYAMLATYPIYSQILAISFPRGFVPVTQETRGPSYLQESVPAGETGEHWTQMLTILGAERAALNPAVSTEGMRDHYVSLYRRSCPESLAMIDLGNGNLTGPEARVVVVSCGSVASANEPHSESMLLIVLKGTEDYYAIQWATRGPASSTPLMLDRTEWTQRLRRLEPIKLCPRVPGEGPPYQSCIGKR
jgi:hypothetical protein